MSRSRKNNPKFIAPSWSNWKRESNRSTRRKNKNSIKAINDDDSEIPFQDNNPYDRFQSPRADLINLIDVPRHIIEEKYPKACRK